MNHEIFKTKSLLHGTVLIEHFIYKKCGHADHVIMLFHWPRFGKFYTKVIAQWAELTELPRVWWIEKGHSN